ncbi:Phospholipase A2-beta [Diplonema papillatum]|nr:Phospholipase A2-beta [Diplonema papillatum]
MHRACLAGLLLAVVASADDGFKCGRECIASNCDNGLSLRWGKYCGIGHGGCPGEKPCDAYDSCCKAHDDCVGLTNMLDTKCHTELKICLQAARSDKEPLFSKKCGVDELVETMSSGMDLANLLSSGLMGAPSGGGGRKEKMKKVQDKKDRRAKENRRRKDEL